MDANKYAVNYDDERLTSVKNEQVQKEQEATEMYDNMVKDSDSFYDAQINASKEWADKQSEIQQANTDFAIEKINQEKEKAEKDYTKEQKASYADYQKQINDYGVNAELMAEQGLKNSGYSETSRVSMYNTYQNRVATARESLNNAVLSYNTAIKEAQLANNSKLAEIANNALQQQLELALQGFQYKNTLLQSKQQELSSISDRYDSRYQNVLNQINIELERQKEVDEMNEQIRQNQLDREQRWAEMEQDKALRREQLAQSKLEADRNYEIALREIALAEKEYNNSLKNSVQVQNTVTPTETSDVTPDELLKGMKWVQGPAIKKPIYDKYSKKYFATVDEMLNYHGYAAVED